MTVIVPVKPVRLLEHPLIAQLLEFDLDPDDFLIFGSGPLLAHGVRDVIHDLDIVARGAAWEWARASGSPSTGVISGTPAARFGGGKIVFFDRWIAPDENKNSPYWGADALIERAVIHDELRLRFASLHDVLVYKENLKRPKDIEDIKAINEYLDGRREVIPVSRPSRSRCPAATRCARITSDPLSLPWGSPFAQST